jgi:hypothetical protein
MTNSTEDNSAKRRAIKYVQQVCKLFSHTTEHTRWDRTTTFVDVYKPMNLAHWFLAIRMVNDGIPQPKFWHRNTMLLDQHVPDEKNELEFQLDKDSFNQSASFYEAFCKRVGI